MTLFEHSRIDVNGKVRPRGWWHAEARAMDRRRIKRKDIAAYFGVSRSAVTAALSSGNRMVRR